MLKGGTLRAKAMRGGAWLGGGSVAEQPSRFARNMILTRLLAPSAFGAMAIVMSSSSIIGAIDRSGTEGRRLSKTRGERKAIPQRRLVDGDGPRDHHVRHYFCHGPFRCPFLRESQNCRHCFEWRC